MGNRKDYPTAEHVKAVTSTLERYTCEEHAVLNDTHQQPYDCVACEVVHDVRRAIALIEQLDAALQSEERAFDRVKQLVKHMQLLAVMRDR